MKLLAAMRPSFLIVTFYFVLFVACVDYGIDASTVPLDRLPDRILARFVRSEPGSTIQGVEVYTHRKGVVSYRVEFRRQDGSLFYADFDRKGERLQYPESHTLPK